MRKINIPENVPKLFNNYFDLLRSNYIHFVLLICLSSFANSLFANNSISDKKQVNIPILGWTSQRVIAKAIGSFLEENQYKVTYKPMGGGSIWGGLARGHAHFHIEVWESGGSAIKKFTDKQRIIDLGTYQIKAMEEWWYPLYVEKLCPGLPDWKALLTCSEIFSNDKLSKGVYHVGPWSYEDAALIRSLKLNFKIEKHKNMNQIWQLLTQANAAKVPILLLNWTPNWTDQRIPGNFVKFPSYSPLCISDPSWGVNPKMTHDCGNVQNSIIKKLAWINLPTALPCVYSFIKNIQLNNQMLAEAAALVKFDSLSENEAAKVWLEKYSIDVNSWSNNTCIGTT